MDVVVDALKRSIGCYGLTILEKGRGECWITQGGKARGKQPVYLLRKDVGQASRAAQVRGHGLPILLGAIDPVCLEARLAGRERVCVWVFHGRDTQVVLSCTSVRMHRSSNFNTHAKVIDRRDTIHTHVDRCTTSLRQNELVHWIGHSSGTGVRADRHRLQSHYSWHVWSAAAAPFAWPRRLCRRPVPIGEPPRISRCQHLLRNGGELAWNDSVDHNLPQPLLIKQNIRAVPDGESGLAVRTVARAVAVVWLADLVPVLQGLPVDAGDAKVRQEVVRVHVLELVQGIDEERLLIHILRLGGTPPFVNLATDTLYGLRAGGLAGRGLNTGNGIGRHGSGCGHFGFRVFFSLRGRGKDWQESKQRVATTDT